MSRFRGLLADTTPLQNLAFRRLWIANIVTVVGAQLSIVAVPQQIFAITRSSAYVGLASLFALVPLALPAFVRYRVSRVDNDLHGARTDV